MLTNERDYKQLHQIFMRSRELLNNFKWLHFISDKIFHYSPNTNPLDNNKRYSYAKLFSY